MALIKLSHTCDSVKTGKQEVLCLFYIIVCNNKPVEH